MHWPSFVLAAGGFLGFSAAIDPIEVSGNKFFKKDGSQFFIKGVAYQLVPLDPLVNPEQCRLDADLMMKLGVNTIRVYHVDAKGDHDDCMGIFADAGIYVLADLDTFDTYIVQENQYWNVSQFERYADVMDAFQRYDNTLGFFIGNENIARREDSVIAPYLKAAARDMKAYRDSKEYRKIPVGYSAADIQELRPMLQNYLTCGGNSSEIVDFFGLNSYAWCDPSSFNVSSYNMLEEYAKDFPVPIFLSETGCIIPGPRVWDDQDAIFGPQMVDDWSGAIIYEWIQEQNSYGLITYGPPANQSLDGGPTPAFYFSGTPTPRSPDFDGLQSKWATLHPTGVSKADYNPSTISTRPCPSATPDGWWEVDGNVKLPTLGDVPLRPDVPGTGSDGEYPTMPSDPAGPKSTHDSSTGNDGDEGNSTSGDKRITSSGLGLIVIVLTFTLLL